MKRTNVYWSFNLIAGSSLVRSLLCSYGRDVLNVYKAWSDYTGASALEQFSNRRQASKLTTMCMTPNEVLEAKADGLVVRSGYDCRHAIYTRYLFCRLMLRRSGVYQAIE